MQEKRNHKSTFLNTVHVDNIELLLKLKSSIEIARIIAASAEHKKNAINIAFFLYVYENLRHFPMHIF